MNLFVRAHDLGVLGIDNITDRLCQYGLDGVQMVAYKALQEVEYQAGSITGVKADEIACRLKECNKSIAMIGAYFNPIHSNADKARLGARIFCDYIDVANKMACNLVGSETGSYNDDKWTYHPDNRSDQALQQVVNTFAYLAGYAKSRNCNIALEGAFGHVCYSVSRLKQAVDMIGYDNVKVIFDLYNYLDITNLADVYDILEEGLVTFGDKIVVCHIKDFVVDNCILKQVGVGKGILDYRRILTAILQYCPAAKLVLEGTVGSDIPFAVKHLQNICMQ